MKWYGRVGGCTLFTVCAAMVVAGVAAQSSQGIVTQFREGGGDGFVDVVVKDTLLDSTNSVRQLRNYGSATLLDVLNNATTGGLERVMLLQYVDIIGGQVGQIPAGASIVSARLSLLAYDTITETDGQLTAYRLTSTGDWREGTAGGNTEQTFCNWLGADGIDGSDGVTLPWGGGASFDIVPDGADYTSAGAASATYPGTLRREWLYFDVTQIVQAWATGGANYGFVVRNTSAPGNQIYMYTSERTLADRPVLQVEYTPEPASLLLLAVGGLLGRRRK